MPRRPVERRDGHADARGRLAVRVERHEDDDVRRPEDGGGAGEAGLLVPAGVDDDGRVGLRREVVARLLPVRLDDPVGAGAAPDDPR